MEEQLEQRSLQKISMLTSDIRWEVKGRELWYQGRLFDVKSMVCTYDSTYLTGLFDEAETGIKENINSLIAHHPDSSQDYAVLTRIFQSLTWEFHIQSFHTQGFSTLAVKCGVLTHTEIPDNPCLGKDIPPPDNRLSWL